MATTKAHEVPSTSETTSSSVTVAGRLRSFVIVRPAHPMVGAPAVLVFHGSNQSAAKLRNFSGYTFDTYAERAGAIVAYLDGYRGHWNDGRLSSNFAARKENVDDVGFAEAVVAFLEKHYRIDASRVFGVGFSNGGQMVIRLTHEVPSVLAGIALISATQPDEDNFMPHLATRVPVPVPTVLIHGTKDPLVPYRGGMASLWGFHPRGLGKSARETSSYYAARNGITAAPVTVSLPYGHDGTSLKIQRTDFRQEDHQPVTLFTVHGGGHIIPNPLRAPIVLGRSIRGFIAADAIGDFFGFPDSTAQ